jgi:hypothetical protein
VFQGSYAALQALRVAPAPLPASPPPAAPAQKVARPGSFRKLLNRAAELVRR